MELSRPLFPLDVLTVRLEIGLVAGAQHAQWVVQVFDPISRERLYMASRPAEHFHTPLRLIEEATAGLAEFIEQVIEPFPDSF